MAEVYLSRLNIDTSLARELAEMTKGYAYAFQELFAYSYEKIWKVEELIIQFIEIGFLSGELSLRDKGI